MGNILIDLNNDREVSELLSVVLYDESHYLRSYLQSMNKELVTIAVERIGFERCGIEKKSCWVGSGDGGWVKTIKNGVKACAAEIARWEMKY